MSKIFVSAGHGGTDSGAVGNGFKEKDLNLSVVLELQKYLERAGHTVVMNRTTDVNGYPQNVPNANASKADCCIEVHHNSGGGTGTESFYYKNDAIASKGGQMATQLCAELSAAFGWANRGAKKTATEGSKYNFGIVNKTTMPANLVEVCFIDSKADMDKWNAKKAAKAIAKALCTVWGGNVTEEVIPEPTPIPTPSPTPTETPLKSGDLVYVKSGAVGYDKGEKLGGLATDKPYSVMEVKGARVVIGFSGKVSAAVDAKYLKKA